MTLLFVMKKEKKVFPSLKRHFSNRGRQKSSTETVHAHCCCGVTGSLAALGDVWCPCAEGQGQQRRVCVAGEWTAEESAPPSAESAEHTRVGEGKPARGCGLVKHATPRLYCESLDK